MSFFARHPRYVFILLCTLLTCLFVLLRGPPAALPRVSPLDYYARSARSLRRYLHDEEVRYEKALEDREAMVRKWGPTAEDVKAFPERDDFYTLWDFFIPSFRCPHRVERVGTLGDGGKWVCGLERIARQRAPCTIYSFGVNGESSFEAALLDNAPGCQVWGYDYSVASFGPEVHNDTALRARSHFYPFALAGEDAPYDDPPRFTLQTLMRQNGHKFIDILKVDIEGAEFESLAAFVEHFVLAHAAEAKHPHKAYEDPTLPVGQLQIEIHARGGNGESFAAFKQWWEMLEYAGLRPFATEPNLVYVNLVRGVRPDLAEYSFMNIRGKHALVDDSY